MGFHGVLHVSVGVGDSVGEPDFVPWVLKFVVETQGVVIVGAFTAAVVVLKKFIVVQIVRKFGLVDVEAGDVVGPVFYVVAGALPAVFMLQGVEIFMAFFGVALLELLKGKNNGFHADLEE